MTVKKEFIAAILLTVILLLPACPAGTTPKLESYEIDADTQGVIELVNNIYNTVIVSNDPNVYKAEYEAGFIQGKLQGMMLPAARDNSWDMAYLIDPSHSYPRQIPPTPQEIELAQRTLKANWEYTLDYIRSQGNTNSGKKLRRLMYRLVGIYHGAVKDKPQTPEFGDNWLPVFTDSEMAVGYEASTFTFMDLYFINAVGDLFDILPNNPPPKVASKPSRCSAFVKHTGDDIFLTHNSWYGFMNQTQALTLWVNGDFMTVNILAPGYLGSNTDFGYNNKGLIFNETTDHATYTEPKTRSLWTFWRSTLAEQFAASIGEFFDLVSLEPSGTYMNGYMLVDAKTKEIGLVEMSYKSFVLFKSDNRGGIEVSTKPEGLNKAYDRDLVRPDFLLGINYAASQQVRDDVKAVDTRPARKRQFLENIGAVNNIESSKSLIIYTDPDNPLSIFGRWDLGYGETPSPKTVPDGSVDAKAVSVSMINYVFDLKGVLDTKSPVKTFWMKFGTPYVKGEPFVWSKSQWKGWKLRYVPDVIDGEYTLLNAYMR